MKSRDRITLIKKSMANFPGSDFLETGTKLFAAILGNDFSDSAYNKTFSAAGFLDQYDEGNYNEEKVKKDDDKFIKSIISNVHLSLIITKKDLKKMAEKEGAKWEGKDESLWGSFIFLVAEAKGQRDYPKKADYERITRIINRRMSSPVVILLCRARSRKVSLSLIDRRVNKIQRELDVLGDKVSMLYAINCRKPSIAALKRLKDLSVVALIKNLRSSQDNKYFDTIVQEWHKIISVEKLKKEETMKRECNVDPRTIFCHDNIDVLREINDECIDLIYLDPPFNKNKTFTAPLGTTASDIGASFKDTWGEEDLKDESMDHIEGEENLKEYLDSVKNFNKDVSYYCYLVSMALRLLEMRRILRPGGSLYYHCDYTMSHYIKILLDMIFEDGLKNEIIWSYVSGGVARNSFPRKHDSIYFYTKRGGEHTFNPVRVRKEGIRESDIWIDEKDGEECIWYIKPNTNKSKPKGVRKLANKYLGDVWEMPIINPMARERVGYPTQKPIALLERIITASSNEGDMVLDPFCGCATACVAAEKLERNWVGIDISDKAYELVIHRLAVEVPRLFKEDPNFSKDKKDLPKRSK